MNRLNVSGQLNDTSGGTKQCLLIFHLNDKKMLHHQLKTPKTSSSVVVEKKISSCPGLPFRTKPSRAKPANVMEKLLSPAATSVENVAKVGMNVDLA